MSILFELRYPTKWYTKVFTAVVALAFFVGLATLAIAGFLVYRIVKPQRTSSEITMSTFPGRAGCGAVYTWRPVEIVKAGFSRDCAARRRLFCVTDTNRAAANC